MSVTWLPVAVLMLLGTFGVGLRQEAALPKLEVQGNGLVWQRIAADVEETRSTGSITRSSDDLDLTDANAVGLRFTDIDIPRGATILEAHLFLLPSASSSGAATMRIYAQNSDNAATFTDNPYEVTNRPRTPFITWSVPTWTASMTLQDPAVMSPDLASIVQTVVNRAGWKPGNALAFIIETAGVREAHALDGELGNKPALEIIYTTDDPPAASASASCLQSADRVVVANPTNDVQYTVENYGQNVGIDARGKTFLVTNEDSNGDKPLQVQHNGSSLCISGGKYATLDGDNAPWDAYHFGPTIYVVDSPNIVLDNLAVHHGGDAIAFIGGGNGTDNWVLRDSYIRHAGDDAIENDAKFNGLIDDVLVDWAYMGVSCRSGSWSGTIKDPPGTVTIQDSLLALKKQEGTFNPESSPGHLFMFKWEKDPGASTCKLRLKNTIFYLQQNNQVFDSIANPSDFVIECSNVTLVYVGDGSYSQANRDALQDLKDKFPNSNCFDIKEGAAGAAFWKQARDDWFARHTNNPQIAYYRYREPSGEN